jgi:hypothetical protein
MLDKMKESEKDRKMLMDKIHNNKMMKNEMKRNQKSLLKF